MKKAVLKCALVGLIISHSQPASAVDPGTAAAIAQGISMATNFLKKDPGDLTLDVVLKNRELLLAVHNRLDSIEQNLAQLSVAVAGLPEEIYQQSLAARQTGLGARIAAIGDEYLLNFAAFIEDRNDTNRSSTLDEQRAYIFREDLQSLILEASLLHSEFKRGSGATSFGALTQVTAAYIEIAMRLQLVEQFGGSERRLINAASKYHRQLQLALDPNLEWALPKIIRAMQANLQNRVKNYAWGGEIVLEDISTIIGRKEGGCITIQAMRRNNHIKHVQVPLEYAPPALARIGFEWRAVALRQDSLFVEFSKDQAIGSASTIKPSFATSVQSPTKNNCDLALPIEFSAINVNPEGRWKDGFMGEFVRGALYRHEIENLEHEKVWLFVRDYNTLAVLKGIKEATEIASAKMKTVMEGDFTGVDFYEITSIDKLGISDLYGKLLNHAADDEISDIAKRSELISSRRADIHRLIAQQESELTTAFARAADAAKTNRILGYISTGAHLVAMYNRNESKKRDLKELQSAIQSVATMIETDERDRSPATNDLAKGLRSISDNISWWAGLVNAQKQNKSLNEAREKIAADIPNGEVHKYDVFVFGTEFRFLGRTGEPRLLDYGVRSVTTIDITGTGDL